MNVDLRKRGFAFSAIHRQGADFANGQPFVKVFSPFRVIERLLVHQIHESLRPRRRGFNISELFVFSAIAHLPLGARPQLIVCSFENPIFAIVSRNP